METPLDIKIIETYGGVPILELQYPEPTLLTAEKELAQARALLQLPHLTMAVVINYRNLSNASDYGPEEQANVYQTPEFLELKKRAVTIVRYHAASFTSMIQTMRANMLIRSSLYSNFAPDLEAGLRVARRAIDHVTARIG